MGKKVESQANYLAAALANKVMVIISFGYSGKC